MMLVRQPYQITKEVAIMDDKNTLAHTSWRCKYHIVFAPKYKRNIWEVPSGNRKDDKNPMPKKRYQHC